MYFIYISLQGLGLISNRITLLLSEFYAMAFEFTTSFFPLVKQKEKNIFPAILSLFLFLIMLNLSGIVPYTTTITTHFIVTGGLAISFNMGIFINNLLLHGAHFLNFFLPHGIPTPISPFLVIIEIVLYIFRPLSLAIRLFANMMAGHALLKIISGGIYMAVFKVLYFFPPIKIIVFLVLIGALNCILILEVLVCIIQAYVFTLLICIYIKDSYVAGH